MEYTYHITWFDSIDDYHSKGENFKGINPEAAIGKFMKLYPSAIFLSCVSIEVLSVKSRAEQTMG